MVRNLEGVRSSNPHPLFSGDMAQYHIQTVNFRTSKKDLSIAAICALKNGCFIKSRKRLSLDYFYDWGKYSIEAE
jgi:hypothetical protein